MKIIGEGDSELIVTARRDELARILGYHYAGEAGCPRLTVGSTINVNTIYESAKRAATIRKELSGHSEKLRKLADSIDEVPAEAAFEGKL